ncbi:hypothetical protein EJ04DRAFT_516756 [Polyplosphaeria fusca]|uniref:PH domain-containing protein n=1 Tax=Polyplosphaeria fusca TaxID=682080 RepID=A0A9P4QKZ1_9PLEO|nr:hypothetical protein EJ04DRAFT_516756 [Polyplosphaeria fusca]
MATETSPPEVLPPPAKFSRYRSVRRAQEQQLQQSQVEHQQTPPVPAMPPIPDTPIEHHNTVSRSFSRYRARPTTSHSQGAPPLRSRTIPEPLPSIPANAQTQNAAATARIRALSTPQQASSRPANNAQPRVPNTSKTRSENAPLVAKGAREPPQSARDEAKRLMQKEAERQRYMQEKLRTEKEAKLAAERAEQEKAKREREEKLQREEDEAERLRAQREADEAEQERQRKQELERGKRLQKAESAARLKQRHEDERKAKAEEAARTAPASPPTSPPKHGGAFGLFKRRKDDAPASPESPANGGRPRQTSNGNRDLDTIRPGGGGAVLGIDAPISAVNAGDRRVMVCYGNSHMRFPVTPTTTPLDLIKSAATCFSEPIDVRTAAILESFSKVGLKRPLRNYEHVRDVMNSWDDDNQNDLVIIDTAKTDIDQQDLLAYQVSEKRPEGKSFYIHYSTRPGKWSKRYFTLREDGQLVMSKSESAKDTVNVCHLSDFDIYLITERKLSKVKPPKKSCYAIKSQQKSNVFLDESRFVHFFCTNDKRTAGLFYHTLQGWRSWYLKNVMGEGQKKAAEAKPTAAFVAARKLSGNEHDIGASHARNASVGSHYQLGSFTPLLDFDANAFSKEPTEEFKPGSFPEDAPLAKLNSRAMHARKMSTRTKGPPPLSYSMTAVSSPPSAPSGNHGSLTQSTSGQPDEDTFAAGGLLGRTYSKRQRDMQEKESKKSTGPFTEGSNLLNNVNFTAASSGIDSGLNRRSSVRSTHRRTSSDIQRSTSTRVKPKPLVDLTPQYKEPPQHANKGKGYQPSAGGPLVENATSMDEAIKVPSSTDWRSRPSAGRPTHGTYGTGGHERTRSLRGGRGEGLAAYTANNHSGAPEDDSNAFTGGGLLARAGFSQGHTPVGHGVMDGSKARGPMLDMRENSRFAQGSLLATVERTQGPTGPVVDRDKRRSVDLG